jgi:murein hydrolase activator
MRKGVLILFFLILVSFCLSGQSRKDLEEKRKKNLEEIEYVDKLLQSTAKERKENLGEIQVIGNKLSLRENIINEYGEEISLLEYRMSLNRIACEMMDEDLGTLREEYKKSIISAYKTQKGTPAIAYILSARDFNQGYKRLKYIQQIARYRRDEAKLITDIYTQLQDTRTKLKVDLESISDLKAKEERQKEILSTEQQKKEKLVQTLTKKEKQLRNELDEKKKIAKQIEAEIARVIEEESKKAYSKPVSNEMKIVGDSFEENKGNLPWPVERGIITSHFGIQKHPVLTNVTEDNIGIEITTTDRAKAKAVFKGQVVRVFSISGANMAVIVRHGKFLTVYQNLVNVSVVQGANVTTGQEIGEVFLDPSDGGKSVLKFMVYLEKTKLNPEQWLQKKSG